MVSFELWKLFPPIRWLISGLLVFVLLYLVFWYCAVYRLTHAEIRPKLRLAAEVLAIEPTDADVLKARARGGEDDQRFATALRDLLRERIACRLGHVMKLYDDFAFRPRERRVELQRAFVELATDLALVEESSRGFAVALVRLDPLGKRWNNREPQEGFTFPWRENYHTRQGASLGIPLPLGGAGSLRDGAREYLQYRNAFDFWRQDDVGRELSLDATTATSTNTTAADSAGVTTRPTAMPTNSGPQPDFRHLARFVDSSVVHRPWHLLRWSDPSFYHNAGHHPFAVLALILTTFFFLDLRYAGWGSRAGARTAPSIFEGSPDAPQWAEWLHAVAGWHVNPERFWLGVSFAIAGLILIFGEKHETNPEWIASFVVLPLAALLVPTLIGSLAAMSRTKFTTDFRQLSFRERLVRLTGFNLAVVATIVMVVWLSYYSLFGLVLSFKGGPALRGLLQLVIGLSVLYWLTRLVVHVFAAPQEPRAAGTPASPHPDFAQTLFGRVLEGSLIILLPIAATLLEWLNAEP